MASDAEIAQAVETVKMVRDDFRQHVVKFEAHVERQQSFNEKITERVNEGEKADIAVTTKLDLTIEQNRAILEAVKANSANWWTKFQSLTPWALVLLGLIYFYIQNKGPMPG